MLDVKKLVFQLGLCVICGRSVLVLDLRPPGYARPYRMPLGVVGYSLLQHFHEVRPFRTRADNAHIAAQRIYELRYFIQPVTP